MDTVISLDRQFHRINGEKKEKFDLFFRLLTEYNARYNLTSIKEEKEVYIKHFLDSSAAADIFEKGASVAEVGSGAGFPSLVIKLLREDLQFSLFESVGKKCEFLKVAVDNLGLSGVNIYNIRAEDAVNGGGHREKFDYCVARAVARMNSLSEYCLPLVKVGGTFIAYKSGDISEIEEAKSAYKALGGKLEFVLPYSLPEGYGERVLAGVKKTAHTPNKYPRGQGKERKSPL